MIILHRAIFDVRVSDRQGCLLIKRTRAIITFFGDRSFTLKILCQERVSINEELAVSAEVVEVPSVKTFTLV